MDGGFWEWGGERKASRATSIRCTCCLCELVTVPWQYVRYSSRPASKVSVWDTNTSRCEKVWNARECRISSSGSIALATDESHVAMHWCCRALLPPRQHHIHLHGHLSSSVTLSCTHLHCRSLTREVSKICPIAVCLQHSDNISCSSGGAQVAAEVAEFASQMTHKV
jgi:hypothetical protein